jgi:hypothetical protein
MLSAAGSAIVTCSTCATLQPEAKYNRPRQRCMRAQLVWKDQVYLLACLPARLELCCFFLLCQVARSSSSCSLQQ